MKPLHSPGGREWARGRKFSSDDLQLMLLGLLRQGPSHGYELMKALAVRSNGFYSPSPGMVYPALSCLEDQGLAQMSEQGGKKRYQLTSAGEANLASQAPRVDTLFQMLEHMARKMSWMQRAWSGEPPQLGEQGQDIATGWLPDFVAAREALREALMRHSGATPDQQRRIAAILRRAVAEIDDASCP